MSPLFIDTANGSFSFLDLENVQITSFPKPELEVIQEGFDLDRFITNKVINEVLTKYEFNCLILPFSLTDNFLEFIGLRLAYHIRLSESLGQKQNIPILFIGNQTPWEIGRLTPLAEIISLEGSYWSRVDKPLIERALSRLPSDLPGLRNRDLFLNRIRIEPPANYSSHHSIANEWSLLRWSKYIKADSHLEDVKRNLESLLYYKYLASTSIAPSIQHNNKFCISEKGKILLIDDESKLGWSSFYQNFFSSSSQVSFTHWDFDYVGRDRQDIISKFHLFFNEELADVVLLDLRLCDEDFNEELKPEELTGCQILKTIKNKNKGIQVIIVSASNKIWNYRELVKLGADGFVIKESPEFHKDVNSTQQSITTLKEAVEKGIKDGVYLKFFWRKTIEATSNVNKLRGMNKVSQPFSDTAVKLLELSYENVASNLDVRFSTSFILYFNLIEAFCNEIIDSDNSICHPKKSNKITFKFRDGSGYLQSYNKSLVPQGDIELENSHIPWLQKILNTAVFLGVSNTELVNLKKLVDLRSDFIHQNLVKNKPVIIEREHTKAIFQIAYKMCMSSIS